MADLTEECTASASFSEGLCFGKAWPLPSLSPAAAAPPPEEEDTDTYAVVVVGAGPAGLLLTLELTRLGLDDKELICVDVKDEGTRSGHADGVNARSQEILRTLGLEGMILREGGKFAEMAFWGRSEEAGIERKDLRKFEYTDKVRFDQVRTIHQSRIKRVFRQDLRRYSHRGVGYSTRVKNVWLDEKDAKYPVRATLECPSGTRTVRAKFPVGADGAHSVVRKGMDVKMEGDITDRVWGMIDYVVDTNFPDIRRPTNFEGLGAGRGDGLVIPRERNSNGEYVTRLYIDMTEYDEKREMVSGGYEMDGALDVKSASWNKKVGGMARAILEKGTKLMGQYRFGMKEGTQPFWWAPYSVGQRLAEKYVVEDAAGMPRIFLAGDGRCLICPNGVPNFVSN